MSTKIRAAVIDDHPLLREGVVQALRRDTQITVVAEGCSAEDALAIAGCSEPNIMLLDVNMPGGGIEAARSIAETHPDVRLIMLTVSDREEDVTSAISAGAKGYVLKGISGAELVRMVHSVFGGDTYITPALAARLFSMMQTQISAKRGIDTRQDPLTARERQILNFVSLGLSNKEVGSKLDLSEKTVKHYMTTVLQKLQVRNRVEAICAYNRMNSGTRSESH